MMKINKNLFSLLLIMLGFITASTSAMAQDSLKHFTLEDLNYGGRNYYNMIPKNKFTTWWGEHLVSQSLDKCSLINTKNGKESTLFTLEDINKCLNAAKQTSVNSLYYATFPYPNQPLVVLFNKNNRYIINFKTKKLEWTQSLKNAQELEWNPVSREMAYLGQDDNLYVRDAQNHNTQLSKDGSRNIVYGQSIHRDEFGYKKGTFWSPNGKLLAFTRMDQSMVTDYPQVNIPDADWKPENGESKIATLAPDKYPMAGEKMHQVSIGVYDTQTHKTVYLQTGDPTNRYFTNPAWSPDSKRLYLFELNRDQNDCRLVSYDALTGKKIAELYRETDSKYVEPQHPIVFLPWDSNKFIMQSQKDGYNHLYLFDTTGHQLKQLTSGKWVVMDLLGFNPLDKSVIIASNEISPIQRNLFAVNVNTGQRTRIDENGQGYHYGYISPTGNYIVDRYSTPTIPRNISIINVPKKTVVPYFVADNPWKKYEVPQYKCGTIKAADGVTDLYYRMVLPINFDPKKKYPTIVYVYGGPHAHNVDARWHYGSRSWETYMAQKGYILFILDNRGSENRGKEFEQVTFRHLGDNEVKDQMEGVKFLKSLPYVDANRLGVHGWSFGGFMTINLMTTYPDVFKVGVAGGPVIDWKWYEVMYGERYMDTPETNPEGYKQSSLLPKIHNLKGKLQIIIGLNDPTVVPQHALTYLKQCILEGKQPDFFVYPGEPHNMRGHQSTHLHERISDYFDTYLK